MISIILIGDFFFYFYFTQPKGETFEFPDLFPIEKEEEIDKQRDQLETLKKEWTRMSKKNRNRKGVPTWFGL